MRPRGPVDEVACARCGDGPLLAGELTAMNLQVTAAGPAASSGPGGGWRGRCARGAWPRWPGDARGPGAQGHCGGPAAGAAGGRVSCAAPTSRPPRSISVSGSAPSGAGWRPRSPPTTAATARGSLRNHRGRPGCLRGRGAATSPRSTPPCTQTPRTGRRCGGCSSTAPRMATSLDDPDLGWCAGEHQPDRNADEKDKHEQPVAVQAPSPGAVEWPQSGRGQAAGQ